MDTTKQKAIDTIAGASGAVAGGTIGTLLAGPLGGAIGGLAGYGIQFGILSISEHINKSISAREASKIATVLDYAVKKIHERMQNGDLPRTDGFFDNNNDDSADKEIFEGIVLAAQREHEAKKLRFMGNLYANIAFSPNISRMKRTIYLRLPSH